MTTISSKRSPQGYLFLDFDGVLHGYGKQATAFEHVAAFEAVVRPFIARGRLAIVISSAWRRTDSLPKLRKRFSSDIGVAIVGVTPCLEDLHAPTDGRRMRTPEEIQAAIDDPRDPSAGKRQREIEAWLQLHAPSSAWLALDDDCSYFEPGCQSLLQTHPSSGLTHADLQTLTLRLQALGDA